MAHPVTSAHTVSSVTPAYIAIGDTYEFVLPIARQLVDALEAADPDGGIALARRPVTSAGFMRAAVVVDDQAVDQLGSVNVKVQ